jgi:hypothetical protein
MSDAVREEGIVAWNYRSTVEASAAAPRERIPVSVSVGRIGSGDVSQDVGGVAGALRLLPLLSFAAPPIVFINSVPGDISGCVPIKPGELQRIIAQEAMKAGVFDTVSMSDEASDFEITGDVNLRLDMYRHMGGLGMAYTLSAVGELLLPGDFEAFSCRAHLQVTCRESGKTVLSKDYEARTGWHCWWLYNSTRIWECYGQDVFPQVVEAFLNDVKAVPADAWEEARGERTAAAR